jgi:hypothetical protein
VAALSCARDVRERKVNPSMMYGARNHAMIEAAASTMSAPVTTLEIDFQARRSPSMVRRSTNTGMNVAVAIPPRTRSKSILGTVLERLNASAIAEKPSTQARTSTRAKPVMRETSVPLAMDSTREE